MSSSSTLFSSNNFCVVSNIGEGTYGSIFLVFHPDNPSKRYVLKQIPLRHSAFRLNLLREMWTNKNIIQSSGNNLNIVSFKHVFLTLKHVYILMDAYIHGLNDIMCMMRRQDSSFKTKYKNSDIAIPNISCAPERLVQIKFQPTRRHGVLENLVKRISNSNSNSQIDPQYMTICDVSFNNTTITTRSQEKSSSSFDWVELLNERKKLEDFTNNIEQNIGLDTWALEMARQLEYALLPLAKNGIIHNDLKPGNVLIDIESNLPFGRIKLIDYGLTQSIDQQFVPELSSSLFCCPYEFFKKDSISHHSIDSWGIGITIASILCKHDFLHEDACEDIEMDSIRLSNFIKISKSFSDQGHFDILERMPEIFNVKKKTSSGYPGPLHYALQDSDNVNTLSCERLLYKTFNKDCYKNVWKLLTMSQSHLSLDSDCNNRSDCDAKDELEEFKRKERNILKQQLILIKQADLERDTIFTDCDTQVIDRNNDNHNNNMSNSHITNLSIARKDDTNNVDKEYDEDDSEGEDDKNKGNEKEYSQDEGSNEDENENSDNENEDEGSTEDENENSNGEDEDDMDDNDISEDDEDNDDAKESKMSFEIELKSCPKGYQNQGKTDHLIMRNMLFYRGVWCWDKSLDIKYTCANKSWYKQTSDEMKDLLSKTLAIDQKKRYQIGKLFIKDERDDSTVNRIMEYSWDMDLWSKYIIDIDKDMEINSSIKVIPLVKPELIKIWDSIKDSILNVDRSETYSRGLSMLYKWLNIQFREFNSKELIPQEIERINKVACVSFLTGCVIAENTDQWASIIDDFVSKEEIRRFSAELMYTNNGSLIHSDVICLLRVISQMQFQHQSMQQKPAWSHFGMLRQTEIACNIMSLLLQTHVDMSGKQGIFPWILACINISKQLVDPNQSIQYLKDNNNSSINNNNKYEMEWSSYVCKLWKIRFSEDQPLIDMCIYDIIISVIRKGLEKQNDWTKIIYTDDESLED